MNIKQIAEAAGVSVATVSRVLNHPENVAPATRERIEKIIKETEYTPNWFAQGLNFNTTKTIGVLVPHMLTHMYMEIANGVEEVARVRDYITFMCSVEKDRAMERRYIEQLIQRRVDGIILMFSDLEDGYIRMVEEAKIPVVMVGENRENPGLNSVTVDCRSGAVQMTAHLIEVGHKRISFLRGNDPKQETADMFAGYSNVLRASGIRQDKRLIVETENSIEGGYIGTKRLIADVLPDAIFCTSDEIAYGAIDALKDRGLRVPDDVAVTGFGNEHMANHVEPKLTTVEIPFRKLGIYGARILFDMIDEGRGKHEKRQITLQARMRVRKSCGHKERIGEMF